ncbi:MAG TPA: STAS domain-containing protein [Candidatus Omnitrophota bacterium]|nr:STAS domain-containing protein [Candidatus Omnitrophota bacterium]
MKIQIKKNEQNVTVIALQGDLDFHSSPNLRKELEKLIESQAPKIMIDLAKVEYVDSSGLATFVELYQKMKHYGAKFSLFNLSESVQSVFEIAKLNSIFLIAKTEEEALRFVS